MPVPNTTTFSLSDVRIEIGLGSTTSLSQCFLSANSSGFNPLYEGSKNALLNFRDYDHSGGGVSTTSISLGTTLSDSQQACNNYAFNNRVTRYILSGQVFSNATNLYSNSTGTPNATQGWYSDGSISRFWNGTSFTMTDLCII